MLAVCPSYSCKVLFLNTGAFKRMLPPSFPAASSSLSCVRRSSAVAITPQILTEKSCPPTARYLPSFENSIAQIAFPSFRGSPDLKPPFLTNLPPVWANSTPVLPFNSWARKTRSKSLTFLPCDRTFMYLGGTGKRGMKPMGCENTSASVPSSRRSPASDSSSLTSNGASFFLNRPKKDTRFLFKAISQHRYC